MYGTHQKRYRTADYFLPTMRAYPRYEFGIAVLDLTRFRRHISASSTKLLERQRAQQVKRLKPADSIVETLDVIEHV